MIFYAERKFFVSAADPDFFFFRLNPPFSGDAGLKRCFPLIVKRFRNSAVERSKIAFDITFSAGLNRTSRIFFRTDDWSKRKRDLAGIEKILRFLFLDLMINIFLPFGYLPADLSKQFVKCVAVELLGV